MEEQSPPPQPQAAEEGDAARAEEEAEITRTIQGKIEGWREKQWAKPPPAKEAAAAEASKKSPITIAVRMRPLHEWERASVGQQIDGSASSYEMPEFETVSVVPPSKVCLHGEVRKMGALTDGVTTKAYAVHRAFGPTVDDDELYAAVCRPLTACAKAGGRACCIAYGQTGTGKTYTQQGVQARACAELFAPISAEGSSSSSSSSSSSLASSAPAPALVVVFVSFFELRKDRCYDLLNDRKEVVLRDDGTGDTAVVGLKEVPCASAAEALAALEAGNALRATEATVNNAQSSRSHAVCQFSIGSPASASTAVAVGGGGGDGGGAEAASAEEEKGEKTEEKAPDGAAAEASAADADASGSSSPSSSSSSSESSGGSGGRLRVVDLAGSERREDTRDHSAERLQETKDINYSLGCLKECIRAQLLASKRKDKSKNPHHVPYRNCKLTRLLKENLQAATATPTAATAGAGADRTLFVAHVNPMRSHSTHTRNTLDYTAAMIETSMASQQRKQFAGPEQWSKQQMVDWVAALDGGKYAAIAPSYQITGKMYAVEWIEEHHKRCEAAGGTREDSSAIYDAFHKELKKAKAAARKASAGGGGSGGGGGIAAARLKKMGGGGGGGGGGGFGDGANSLFPTGQKAPPGEEKQQQLSFVAGSDESAEANSAAEKRANKQKMMEAKGGDE